MNPNISPTRRPSKDLAIRIVVAGVIIVFGLALIGAVMRIGMVVALVNISNYREPVLIAHGVRDSANINIADMVVTSRIYLFMSRWPSPLRPVDSPKLTATDQLTEPPDNPEAAACRPKAETGDMASAARLGRMYYDGEGVPVNFNEAFKWLLVAAKQGDAGSQEKVGEIYRDGYIVKQDYSEGLDWFHKAAAQGLPEGQDAIAWMTFFGEGVPKDEREAAVLAAEALPGLQKGADAGDPENMCDLGDLYLYGLGVTTDYALAMSNYQKGADRGNAYGQFDVGSMYEGGMGVPVNIATALSWYRKAAAQGLPDAQVGVAQLGQ